MRNVSDKICRENQNTNFVYNNFFSSNLATYEITQKNMMAMAVKYGTKKMQTACRITKKRIQKYTQNI